MQKCTHHCERFGKDVCRQILKTRLISSWTSWIWDQYLPKNMEWTCGTFSWRHFKNESFWFPIMRNLSIWEVIFNQGTPLTPHLAMRFIWKRSYYILLIILTGAGRISISLVNFVGNLICCESRLLHFGLLHLFFRPNTYPQQKHKNKKRFGYLRHPNLFGLKSPPNYAATYIWFRASGPKPRPPMVWSQISGVWRRLLPWRFS